MAFTYNLIFLNEAIITILENTPIKNLLKLLKMYTNNKCAIGKWWYYLSCLRFDYKEYTDRF